MKNKMNVELKVFLVTVFPNIPDDLLSQLGFNLVMVYDSTNTIDSRMTAVGVVQKFLDHCTEFEIIQVIDKVKELFAS